MSYLSPEVSLTVTGCVLRRIIAFTSTTAEPRLFLVTKIRGLPDITRSDVKSFIYCSKFIAVKIILPQYVQLIILLHLGFKSTTFSADDQGNTIYIEYDK